MIEINIRVFPLTECNEKIEHYSRLLEQHQKMDCTPNFRRFNINMDKRDLEAWSARKEYCETHRVDEVAIYKGKIIDHSRFEKIKGLLEE